MLIIFTAVLRLIFARVINSFKPIYLHLVELFYSDTSVCEIVFSYHKELFMAIKEKNEADCVRVMTKLLNHGAEHLEQIINKKI